MCSLYDDAYSWLGRLHHNIAAQNLDGYQITRVTAAWRAALGRNDIDPEELVNEQEIDRSWRSHSNQLLVELANVTSVDDSRIYLDPDERFQRLAESRRELGVTDDTTRQIGSLLRDLNLRCYVNQRIADFFELPYVCSIARVPFRHHLYNRAIEVQNALVTVSILETRYAELADQVRLRLPVFLAIALRGCSDPESIVPRLASLRRKASSFRKRSAALDDALARRDLREAANVAKALRNSVDSVLAVAGNAAAASAACVIDEISQGDLPGVKTAIQATVAAGRELLHSSFAKRLLWRLRRPHLLWINDVIEEASHLTEALPAFSKVWRIPENRKEIFAQRFQRMCQLQTL